MWHEKMGLKENPFDIRNPSRELIGEEEQEKTLTKWLNSNKAILLYGLTGSGKTTLVKNLCKRINDGSIEELKGTKCMYFACDITNLKDFPRRYFRHKLFSFGKTPIVICDESHFADETELERVTGLWDTHKLKSLVFVQINSASKEDRIVQRIGDCRVEMRVISPLEIYEMLKTRQGQSAIFDDHALRYVAFNSNNNPRTALQRCDLIAAEHAENGKKISLEQTKSFKFPGTKIEEEIKSPVITGKVKDLDASPLEKCIIGQLRITRSTMDELTKVCNADKNTITSKISKLRKEKKIIIVDKKRPKKYGLNKEFERTLLGD